ncbi:hypothetical protein SAMN05421594_0472 [Chryseobacterium oleae]|uniref:Uncharacterized protein n=1 Tax=Chryseobacterium oleae TaxID=491207 RepID=A0A1I4VNJ2_CHROL|nr:hypothetical protein [Chryseobacterium oleae]SFN02858.1 hypothetical protein SAMN05421594_0472 [Chryseobacterium oleae]
MKKKEISFLVSLSDARSLVPDTKETDKDRLITLKKQLEQLDIKVEHLQTLGQLVIHAPEDVWNKTIEEIESLTGKDFQIEPNRLL